MSSSPSPSSSSSSSSSSNRNTRWILVKYGSGKLKESDFELQKDVPIPQLKDGDIKVRIVYASCDPTQMGWSRVDSYMPKVALGDVMRAGGVGVVEESKNSKYKVGQTVTGLLGFQKYFVGQPVWLNVVPPFVSAEAAAALFGMIGATAYYLVEDGRLKKGETLVVSGAAGAVGSLVCQIGALHGLRVIGIAGSAAKCELLKTEFKCDEAICYRDGNLSEKLKEAAPNGVDVYFENVGGDITRAVWPLLNIHGRVIVCGMISQYESRFEGGSGLPLYDFDLIVKRLTIKGILVSDLVPKMGEVMQSLGRWNAAGSLTYKLDVVEGVENCIAALAGIFEGENTGKRVVRISESPKTITLRQHIIRQAAPYVAGSIALIGAAAAYLAFKKK